MEFEFRGNVLKFDRELSGLDKLALKFTRVLAQQGIDYAIISGYIAILFGRSRNTEDIDLFIGEVPIDKFRALWGALEKAGFECINAPDADEGYNEYLKHQLALRFAIKGTLMPNFELKFPKSELNRYSLDNKVRVEMRGGTLNTSKMELQIAYKLFLGSEKDIEDAIHLWEAFKRSLNKELFYAFVRKLKVEDKVKELE